MTWSDARDGGDRGAVRDWLRNVRQIWASSFALAAILADGFVVNDTSAILGASSVVTCSHGLSLR